MGRPNAYRLTLLAIWLLGIVTLSTGAGNAHSESDYYPIKWSGSSNGWKFNPTFPTGNKATRMQESFQTWTNVSSSDLTFNANGVATTGYTASNPCGANATYNGVFYNTSVQYGRTYHCVVQDGPSAFHISRWAVVMQDGNDAFWKDSGSDTGTNVFKSVATHEAGHAGGFGTKIYLTGNAPDQHFLPSPSADGRCWDDAFYNTMCNGLVPAPDKTSTLEAHDIHTVQNAY